MPLIKLLSEYLDWGYKNVSLNNIKTNLVYPNSRKPLVLFHGSDANFDKFKYSSDGGFHFGSFGHGIGFAENYSREDEFDSFTGLYVVCLEVKNVVEVPDLQYWQGKNFSDYFDTNIKSNSYDFDLEPMENLNRPEIKSWFEKENYTEWTNSQYPIDCLVYYNDYEVSSVPRGHISTYLKFMKHLGIDNKKDLNYSLSGKYSFTVFDPDLIKIIYK